MEDNTVFEIDPELMAGFVDEAEEGLATLNSLFIELEAEPGNIETINAIFRPVHTVKGNSAFFGLMKVKNLAHEMESLLTLAKEEKLVLNQSMISVLLAGVDQLKEMLARARDGRSEVVDNSAFDKLIEQIISAREAKEDVSVLWNDFFDKFEKAKADLAKLDSSYGKQLDAVIEIAVQLKPGYLTDGSQPSKEENQDKPAIPEVLQKIKSIFDRSREEGLSEDDASDVFKDLTDLKELVADKDAGDIVDSAIDEYHRFASSVGSGETLLVELLQEKIEKLLLFGDWKTSSGDGKTETSKSKSETPENKAKPTKEAGKTMRVTEDSVDNFLSFVGELIVVGEMYNYLQKNISDSDINAGFINDFKRINETFDNLSGNLQKSIMEIRKVPVRTILQKAPRMIRDIATGSGKDIKVELVGEEIEIDKRLVETLDGPLTHMVRNSADHGIEMPDDRETAGKPRQGTVRIAVTEAEDNVTLKISDDGKGIDLNAIKAKAVKLGIMKSDQQLTEEQLIDLLFASGVSTAQEVTEVSGRGVGMDVVKRNIEAANGKITIKTEQGKGSEFIIRLPRTVSTQIIEGFLVRIGANCYVIPMDKVQEVFRPEANDISSVTGRGQCVLRHDQLLNVIRLSDIFGEQSLSKVPNSSEIMVSANIRKKRIAFCVDEVLGVQKVVLKDLEGLELDSQLYSAAAVMGNGTVAMVLDIALLAGTTIGA